MFFVILDIEKEVLYMNKIIKPIQPVKLRPPIKQKPQQDKPKENPSK